MLISLLNAYDLIGCVMGMLSGGEGEISILC